MLDEAIEYLENRQKEYSKFTYEVIVVSDGSRDQTVEVAQSYAQKFGTDKVRCLKLIKNRGKGGAVRLVISISIILVRLPTTMVFQLGIRIMALFFTGHTKL